MNPRRQLYILAFAAYTTSLVVMAALAWLAIQYNTVAGVVQLTIALSGNGLGGFALVLGLLRDDRAERERRRADEAAETAKNAVEAAKKSEQKASEAQELIGQLQVRAEQLQAQAERERQQAEQERQRAERAEAELRRVRDGLTLESRFRRIEEALGLPPSDMTPDDQSGESQ